VNADHQITKKAAADILCVAELRQFLDELGKASEGHYPESLKPKARIAFGGGIKSISVIIPGEAEQQ
jgi:hypothetical protein